MSTRELIEGLNILSKYTEDKYNIGAEHDVIYFYPTSLPLSDEDLKEIIRLGWHQEYDERDYSEDFSVSHYRQDETWCFYT